jgi:hypothetical protein
MTSQVSNETRQVSVYLSVPHQIDEEPRLAIDYVDTFWNHGFSKGKAWCSPCRQMQEWNTLTCGPA